MGGELTAGEAERDGAPDPHGWRARFAALGLDDPVALATAGTAHENERMAYIAERFDAERDGIGNPGGWLRKLILTGSSPPVGWTPASEQQDAERRRAALLADKKRERDAEIERDRDEAWAWFSGLGADERATVAAALISRHVLPEGGALPEEPTTEQRTEVLGLSRLHQHAEGSKRVAQMIRQRRGSGEIRKPRATMPVGGHARQLERWDAYWSLDDVERRDLCGDAIDAGLVPAERPDGEPEHDALATVAQAMHAREQAKLERAIEAAANRQPAEAAS